jgi:hypothetical protein
MLPLVGVVGASELAARRLGVGISARDREPNMKAAALADKQIATIKTTLSRLTFETKFPCARLSMSASPFAD